jgi:hypothetical protein
MYSGIVRTRSTAAFLSAHAFKLNIATTILVIACAAVYIIQVNGSVAKGYAIRELEDQINELTIDNQKLEVDAREAQALQNVTRSVKMIGLVSAETPTYVSAAAPAVAMAR